MPTHLTLVPPAKLDLRESGVSVEPATLSCDRGLPLDDITTSQPWSRPGLDALRGFLIRLIEGGALSDPTLFQAPGDVSRGHGRRSCST
jgi:hypothetical protein